MTSIQKLSDKNQHNSIDIKRRASQQQTYEAIITQYIHEKISQETH